MNKTLAVAILLSIFCFGAVSVEAAGVAGGQTIDKAMMDATLDEKLFIKTSGTVSRKASCSTHPVWDFVVDTSTPLGIQIYAILMTMYKDGTPITLNGTGTCGIFSGIETLNRIDLL